MIAPESTAPLLVLLPFLGFTFVMAVGIWSVQSDSKAVGVLSAVLALVALSAMLALVAFTTLGG